MSHTFTQFYTDDSDWLPAVVLDVPIAPGQQVQSGETMLVVLVNYEVKYLVAEEDVVVQSIKVAANDELSAGVRLFTLQRVAENADFVSGATSSDQKEQYSQPLYSESKKLNKDNLSKPSKKESAKAKKTTANKNGLSQELFLLFTVFFAFITSGAVLAYFGESPITGEKWYLPLLILAGSVYVIFTLERLPFFQDIKQPYLYTNISWILLSVFFTVGWAFATVGDWQKNSAHWTLYQVGILDEDIEYSSTEGFEPYIHKESVNYISLLAYYLSGYPEQSPFFVCPSMYRTDLIYKKVLDDKGNLREPFQTDGEEHENLDELLQQQADSFGCRFYLVKKLDYDDDQNHVSFSVIRDGAEGRYLKVKHAEHIDGWTHKSAFMVLERGDNKVDEKSVIAKKEAQSQLATEATQKESKPVVKQVSKPAQTYTPSVATQPETVQVDAEYAKRKEYRKKVKNFSFPRSRCARPEVPHVDASKYKVERASKKIDQWWNCLTDASDNDLQALRKLILAIDGTWEWNNSEQTSWSWASSAVCDCKEDILKLAKRREDRHEDRNNALKRMSDAISLRNKKVDEQEMWDDFNNAINSIDTRY